MFYLLLISTVGFVIAENDPCLTTTQITDEWRSTAYTNTTNNCDALMWEGWYVVTSNGGSEMPTACPTGGFRCGTTYPLYLSPDHNPSPLLPSPGATVDRVVCSADFLGDCCKEQVNITIKNCGQFYVYYLRRPTSCPTAYCFGNNLPCPPGENSENGFSPGCGNFPNVTVQSISVTSGLFPSNKTVNNIESISETVQFQCHTNVDIRYRYDVRWFIDDFEIANAVFLNMSHTSLVTDTMLLQHHWDTQFKPNMRVKCSIQIRDTAFPSPGPRKYSNYFMAGVEVKQDDNSKILVEGDPPVGIDVILTIPIGCQYPKNAPPLKPDNDFIAGRIAELSPSFTTRMYSKPFFSSIIIIENIKSNLCLLNLLTAVPSYQKNPDKCQNGLTEDSLAFQSEMCGVVFSFNKTNKQTVKVSGAVDQMINFNDRLSVLQLYQDKNTDTKIDVLHIWLGLILPEIQFIVKDKDQVTAGRRCESNNDPHMVSFDGKPYELQQSSGEYVMYQHTQLPLKIHSFYQKCRTALCNCGAAVRSGNSLFVANFCGQNNYVTQNICEENDLDVRKQGNRYEVTLPSGTRLLIQMGPYWEENYIITTFHIMASSLDFGMTLGLCGIFNNVRGDDFTTRYGGIEADNEVFAESWRIKSDEESLFNAKQLSPVKANVKEYCSCKKPGGTFPYGQPENNCNVTNAMKPCRDQLLPISIFNGPCKTIGHQRRKRETTDEEPEQHPLELNDTNPVKPDLSWKNGWTEQKAKDHCNGAFQSMASLDLCSTYVPLISVDNFVSDCIFDIQITGSTDWVAESQNNFAVSCLSEASRMENLTKSNATDDDSTENSIFEQIGLQSCPRNCSGNGVCIQGACNCTHSFFGDDCSLPVTIAPVISKLKFNSVCDTSQRPCRKYIVPGVYFREGNVTCRFRSYKIYYNESVFDGITEEADGIFVGPFAIHCSAPETRMKRSVSDYITPSGYYLSVSNDGLNFTEEVPLIIYNSLCFNCNITSMICQEIESCPDKQVPVVVVVTPDDHTTYLIIGICCGLVFAVSLIIVFIIFKSKRKPVVVNPVHGLSTNDQHMDHTLRRKN